MGGGVKILVVEDRAEIQETIAYYLENHDLTFVGTVVDAVHALQDTEWDCVVLDWQFPMRAGEFAHADAGAEVLRRMARRANITPVVVYSAWGDHIAEQALAGGALKFVSKPGGDLLAAVVEVVRG